MKRLLVITFLICGVGASPVFSHAAAAARKLTCCQEAKSKNRECSHKCCVTAHKKGESCARCNPNKEDLVKKEPKKEEKARKS
jgi:hypothetical protein